MIHSSKTFVPSLLALALGSSFVVACGKPTPPPEAPAASTPVPAATSSNTAMPDSTATAAPGASQSAAAETVVPVTLIIDKGLGADAGSIRISDGTSGLQLKADLKGLPPGEHGFHVHQNPDCGAKEKAGKMTAGEAAGEHFDPSMTGKHAGPDGMGHAGDLPRLTVAADGTVTATLSAPRLKVADLKGRSIMVHAEPDDYAGKPGGARLACGVVPQ